MTFIANRSGKVYNQILQEEVDVERVIGRLKGDRSGPTVVFFGGIHGNEPSGVFALQQVFSALENKRHLLSGEFIGLGGNLWALANRERFYRQDLNRMWTTGRMARIEAGELDHHPDRLDEREQLEIHALLQDLLEQGNPPFYFLDLHTTSSDSVPFLTVNDTLVNRKFATRFPVPIILGIEEYLDGPLLSYINELGYLALGFEAGQHEAPSSVANHEAFIYLSLVHSGALAREDLPEYDQYCRRLKEAAGGSRAIYEIRYQYKIEEGERFEMMPGYSNFQPIRKGDDLARSNQVRIESHRDGKIFMPLYQNLGDDGFFIIRRVPRFLLKVSAWIRKRKLDRWLTLLPGVSRHPVRKNTLIVDQRVARFFARDFFHLFGYRSKRLDKDHVIMRNRETLSRFWEYKPDK